MVHILVGTPCYDEKLTTPYVNSILGLKTLCERHTPRIEIDFFFFSHALVAYARNVFASRMLEQKHYTHLLMIDSDMGFDPQLIFQMLAMDRDIMGTIYPKRVIDLDRLVTTARAMPQDTPEWRKRAIAAAYDFVCEGEILGSGEGNQRTINIDQGFAPARAVGTGVMLVKRQVLEKMLARFPELVAPTVPKGATTLETIFFQPFNEYKLPDGHTLSEDLSFCHRWTTEMGGEIWVNVDREFIHHGNFSHKTSLLPKLLAAAVSSTL